MPYGPGGLNPGAKLIASWSNNHPAVAELVRPEKDKRGKIVALNFLPISGDTIKNSWDPRTSDAIQLMANALRYVIKRSSSA